MNSGRTPLEYLRLPNPEILDDTPRRHLSEKKSKKVGSSSRNLLKWPTVISITHWEDFEWNTLRRLFGLELDAELSTPMPQLRDLPDVHETLLRIHSEDCVKMLVSTFHRRVVLDVLDNRPDALRSQKISMVSGSKAVLFYAATKKDCPDWAGTCDRQGHNSILVGDTKLSTAFQATDIQKCVDQLTASIKKAQAFGKFGPIRQLTHYCICAGSRYGFLISEKEMIAVRVGSGNQPPRVSKNEIRKSAHKAARVEFRVIPWDHQANDRGTLSINLALFILHLLAANNGQLDNHPYMPLEEESLIPLEQQPRPDSLRHDGNQPLSFGDQTSRAPADAIPADAPPEPDDFTTMDVDQTIAHPSTSMSAQSSKTRKRIATPRKKDKTPRKSSRGISKRRGCRSGTNSNNASFSSMIG